MLLPTIQRYMDLTKLKSVTRELSLQIYGLLAILILVAHKLTVHFVSIIN